MLTEIWGLGGAERGLGGRAQRRAGLADPARRTTLADQRS
jgi:hypothetical protein